MEIKKRNESNIYGNNSILLTSSVLLHHTFLNLPRKVFDAPDPDDPINDVAAVILAKWRLVKVQLKLTMGHWMRYRFRMLEDQMSANIHLRRRLLDGGICVHPPWKTIINALCTQDVREVTLANKLNTKYCS